VNDDVVEEPVLVDPDTFIPVEPRWWASNFGGMLAFGLVARRSRSRVVRGGFRLAVAVHVVEAIYSYDRARRVGFHRSAGRWALQTLAVGFPSLHALNDAIDRSDPHLSGPAPATF
jgi:hypothetical protein